MLLLKGKSDGGDKRKGEESSSLGPPQANMTVCEGANIFKTGSDPPLKEDSAYPSWLWTIADSVPSYVDLPQDSKQHWRRLNKVKAHERNTIQKQAGNR